LLGYPELTPYLQLAFATLFSLAISSYPGTVLVALGRFGRLGVAGVINAVITVAGIAALLLAGRLDLGTLIAWNVILPVVSTLPTWGLLPADWRPWRGWRAAGRPGVGRELLSFSRWMLITNAGSIITAQLDLLLLGRLATPATVGVYSVALTLALRLDTLNQSLFTVLMPRASRLVGATAIRGYVRRVLAGTLALAAGLAGVALVAVLLLPLLYGDQYRDSAGLFAALTGIVLFDLVTASLLLLAFPLNRPQVLALAEWLRLAVLGIAGWLLIPLYGAYGAVGARFLSRTLGTTYTLWALRRAFHGLSPAPEPDLPPPGGIAPEERGIM
jgi:O-antigen/teichoic acid export membrane protein